MWNELVYRISYIVYRKTKTINDKRLTINQTGQSLMELVVVVAVVVIVVGALTFATIASLRSAVFAQNQAQATKLAQEGLELTRTGRDRNSSISIIGVSTVTSWNGSSTSSCSGSDAKSDSIWCYHVSGNCDRPDLTPPTFCYFNVVSSGSLTNKGYAVSPIPSQTEGIPTGNPVFTRTILLSDDLNHDKNFNNDDFQNQKEVTAIITWKDVSGSHESRLTTILRKI